MIEPMPEHVQEMLIAEARAAVPREICGFVHKGWSGITFMNNVSERDDQFDIPDDALIEFYEAHPDPLGFFHSHPKGRARPSDRDAEYAPRDMRYWIITLDSVYEWDMNNDPPAAIVFE